MKRELIAVALLATLLVLWQTFTISRTKARL